MIIVWLLAIFTSIIAMVGLLGLCIGVLLTAFYAMVINQALLAEVAKAAGEAATSGDTIASVQQSAPTALPATPVAKKEVSLEEGPVKMVG